MALYQSDRTIAFRRAYGKAAPPEKLTQEAFEGNDRHLRRMLRIKPGERPDLQDLWEYLQDLRHTDIQTPPKLPALKAHQDQRQVALLPSSDLLQREA